MIGLGGYGRPLTVLIAPDLDEQIEAIEEEEQLIESWTPQFRRLDACRVSRGSVSRAPPCAWRTMPRCGAWLAAMSDFTSSGLDCREAPAPVTVAFERTVYTAPEGGSAYVRLRLSEALARAVTVAVTVAPGGGATAADYRVPGTVTFWPDATETGIDVVALPDGDADDGETATLGVGALPTGVNAGTPAAATVTIEDLPANAPTFSGVVTQPGLGRLDSLVAVADLDGDGLDDIVYRGQVPGV